MVCAMHETYEKKAHIINKRYVALWFCRIWYVFGLNSIRVEREIKSPRLVCKVLFRQQELLQIKCLFFNSPNFFNIFYFKSSFL